MPYLFDANTLIEAKNRYYAFDVCPAFWDWLILERRRGNVLSIEAVKDELEDPDARAWASANPSFFEPNDLTRLSEVSNWVIAEERFSQASRNSFLGKADPIIIAHALQKGYTVVTQEKPEPSSKKAKIPDVCAALGVNWNDQFKILSELRARFILEVQP